MSLGSASAPTVHVIDFRHRSDVDAADTVMPPFVRTYLHYLVCQRFWMGGFAWLVGVGHCPAFL